MFVKTIIRRCLLQIWTRQYFDAKETLSTQLFENYEQRRIFLLLSLCNYSNLYHIFQVTLNDEQYEMWS